MENKVISDDKESGSTALQDKLYHLEALIDEIGRGSEQEKTGPEARTDDRLNEENHFLRTEAGAYRIVCRELRSENLQLEEKSKEFERQFLEIQESFFWNITEPARKLSQGMKDRFSKWTAFCDYFSKMKQRKGTGKQQTELKQDAPEERQEEISFSPDICFSILVPLHNTKMTYLVNLIRSVQRQTYPNWELCFADGSDSGYTKAEKTCRRAAKRDSRIRYRRLEKNLGISVNTNEALSMAQGEWIALLDHDDLLHPRALQEIRGAISKQGAEFVYTDEALFREKPEDPFQFHFKPDFAPDTLRSVNYICHLTAFSRELMQKAGGCFRPEYDGSQDYDMILRLTEKTDRIVHIPKVLYYWRHHDDSFSADSAAIAHAIEAAKKALAAHMARTGLEGTVEDAMEPTCYHIRYAILGNPLVSILIPNRDHRDELALCVESIRRKTTWKNWEILIIENGSQDPETFRYYQEIMKLDSRVRVVSWKDPFNFSRVCNFGAEQARGDFLLLMNNDMAVVSPQWMEEMLMFAQRPDVGVVGALLRYPDDTVQHGGVIIGIGGTAGHSHKYAKCPPENCGYMKRLAYAQNYSAVTGACMMISRTVWDKVGGYDPAYPLAFGDVDFCLRIRSAGHLNVWTPYADLYHFESKTRGWEDTTEKRERFEMEVGLFRERWKQILTDGDPYYNPNLTLVRQDFSLK